jgi:hypothetical protein
VFVSIQTQSTKLLYFLINSIGSSSENLTAIARSPKRLALYN